MGGSQSLSGLSPERLEDYQSLTYLTTSEIIYLYKKFRSLGSSLIDADFHHRFHMYDVIDKFPVLKHNPFRDRLFRVFSSLQDEHFSFEDMLDLYSVMSDECPDKVKAAWAFRVFDIDEDNQIGAEDISQIIDRLIWDRTPTSKTISRQEKDKIAEVILSEMDLQHIGSMGFMEFEHTVTKMAEFRNSFYFRL